MSKGPDLSAFPIPRKGGAKPIAVDELAETAVAEEEGVRHGPSAQPLPQPRPPPSAATSRKPAVAAQEAPTPPVSGQTVATTVKLDENRYLRLAEAGKPGPGRLKRRSIQEMVIEALDEWFERRGL